MTSRSGGASRHTAAHSCTGVRERPARLAVVLSIGKIGGGNGDPRYYVDAVARGHEDYYTGDGEAQGEWYGSGAASKGLTGSVEEDEFLALLRPANHRTTLGFDLTFSAPKSVSILFGVGDPHLARLTRNAHDAAVREALDYMERNACWTRRGRGGHNVIKGEGLSIALFRHRSSRAGDPQLHTHAVVANVTMAEGRSTALDGRAIYAHARTAGFLYQAALRAELTRHVGVEWEPIHNGLAEIRGIDPDVRSCFSRRRKEIQDRMQTLGLHSARAAQFATLETRRRKDYDVPARRLHDEWRARAEEVGLGQTELEAVLDRRAPGRPLTPERSAIAAHLSSPAGLTAAASTFDRRAVLRELATVHPEGMDADELERMADEWLCSDDVVVLEPGTKRSITGARYSTPEMLELEHQLVEEAKARATAGVGVVPSQQVEQLLANAPLLSDEQRDLVQSLVSSGRGVEVVRAAAGTGKTYALAVARDAWESTGVRVFGCALAARAAVELQSHAGIDSATIARSLQDLRHGWGLPPGSVLVVDEAGMVGTRALLELADHAAETKSKIVLVGDDRQLPELEAGGAFRGIAERVGFLELRRVHRQAADWDRAALEQLRRGNVDGWADAYREQGRLVVRRSATELREQLVTDWWRGMRDGTDCVMVAHRRDDVAQLNAAARVRMREDGRLRSDDLAVGSIAFAVGDQVLARRNDRRLGIVNGARGEVVAIDPDQAAVTMKLEDREVTLNAGYLESGNLTHGYALTAHAAQGATVDRAFVLGSDDLYREWGYTALSRHRDSAHFYVVSPGSVEHCLPGMEVHEASAVDDVVASLGWSRRQEMATEIGERGFQDADFGAAAARRAAELRAAANRMPAWKRRKRSELEQLADANERAAVITQSKCDDGLRPGPMRPRESGLNEMRSDVLDDSPDRTLRIGRMPEGWDGRESWARAAMRLEHAGTRDFVPVRELPVALPEIDLEL
jgi:Ti-type conjugative transfer relaxase TraA